MIEAVEVGLEVEDVEMIGMRGDVAEGGEAVIVAVAVGAKLDPRARLIT